MSDHWISLCMNDLRGHTNKSLDNEPDTSTSRRTRYGWGSILGRPSPPDPRPTGVCTQKGNKAQFDKKSLTKWLSLS